MKINYINGFTILEVLMSNALGLILITVLITIFFNVKNAYQFQTGLQTIHENSNLITHFLSQDIQEAGFIACGEFSAIKNFLSDLTQHTGLLGASNASILPPPFATRVTAGTDTLIVEKLKDPINYLSTSMDETNQLLVYNIDNYKPGDHLLITNCETTEAIQVKESYRLNGTTIITTHTPLSIRYKKNSAVAHLSAIAYFIGQSTHKNNHDQIIHSLYRKDLFSSVFEPDELIEGVNNMKLTYAVLTNGRVEYVLSDAIKNWNTIIGIRITLLLDSIEPALTKNYPFEFVQKKYFPQDFKLYKPWYCYISLRERV